MKIALVWRTKTDRGWKFFPLVWDEKSPFMPFRAGCVIDRGEHREYPSGSFYFRLWRNGQTAYEPLKTSDANEAMRKLMERGRVAKQQPKNENPRNHVKTAITAYIKSLEAQRRMEAAAHARVTLSEFSAHCKCIGLVKSITREHVEDWFRAMHDKGLSERTQFNRYVRLKAWLTWCKVDTEFLPDAPTYEKKEPTIYSAAQVTNLLNAAGADTVLRIAIELGLKCGLRMGEIAHAAWSDLNEDYSMLRVTSKPDFDWRIKDKEQRTVAVPADLRKRLKAWKTEQKKSRVLIIGTRSGKPDRHILRSLKRLARRAGLHCGTCEGCMSNAQECRTFNLHKLRRTYATSLLRSGVDLSSVQRLMGHADIQTTARYLKGKIAPEVAAKIETVQWGG